MKRKGSKGKERTEKEMERKGKERKAGQMGSNGDEIKRKTQAFSLYNSF